MKKIPRFTAERKYDAIAIRSLLFSEMCRCKKSREQIAKEMTDLFGQEVTLRRLNAYVAECREDFRWAAELDIVFCEVVGSYKLLAERVRRAGFRMVGPNEERLIRLGKAYEQKTHAEQILAGGGK